MKRKNASPTFGGMLRLDPLMPTGVNFEPEFRRCVHARERLLFNNGSRLRLGYTQ
jgi:hypothetical protein